MGDTKALLDELERLKRENERLRQQINTSDGGTVELAEAETEKPTNKAKVERLDNDSIQRFSRQLLLKEIGVKGQLALANASVLIVGAGGLGSPSALYLATAGVGRLGIVEHDTIDISNLHRQVIHTEARVGMSKAESAKLTIKSINSKCSCQAYNTVLDSSNALEIIKDYDVVLDASDNVATRYLLNDACILLSKPLVSGSALRFDGQLSVYHNGVGPCYRCLFPVPPPPDSVMNCSDGGVLGPVTGVIGCMQALEAIKIITGIGSSFTSKLLLFDGIDGTFRSVKVRPRRKDCAVCGDTPTITQLQDYVQFCGMAATDKDLGIDILEPSRRIECVEYEKLRKQDGEHVLIDTRDALQTDICKLEEALNIPFDQLPSRLDEIVGQVSDQDRSSQTKPLYFICRRGNDSQRAVKLLLEKGLKQVYDIKGGYVAWREVDPNFPLY